MDQRLKVRKPGGRVYRLVILGDGGVGKSALVMQFIKNEFLNYHDPTIEDAYQHQARIDNDPAQLDILDTAGQPEFTAMREQYMRTGEGFIICYSTTDHRSLDEAAAFRELIIRVRKRDDIPIVLVGNKCDLSDLRKVSLEEGDSLAHKWDCPFFETSAYLRQNIEQCFHELVREIRRREGSIAMQSVCADAETSQRHHHHRSTRPRTWLKQLRKFMSRKS